MKTIAVIPARGGSKGIPRKNLRTVGGVPLVVRTIRAALAARRLDAVFVSTEDAEIARVASAAGARVLTRPIDLAGDRASSESALLHALATIEAETGKTPETLVFLQCTSPFTTPEDIDGLVARVRDGGADCAFTATPTHAFVWKVGEDGGAVAVDHDPGHRKPRQALPPRFRETGAGYAMRVAGFRAAGSRFFGRAEIHPLPAERAQDIDDAADLALCDRLARELDAPAIGPGLPDRPSVLFLDFDGVLTDDRVFVTEDGRETVAAHRGDGLAIERLKKTGLPIVVVSRERNPVVAARCRKLGIECLQGVDEKRHAILEWLKAHGANAERAIFVGNDVNDLPAFDAVGFRVAVADAVPELRGAAHLTLKTPGGRGAVRELCEMLINIHRKDTS